MSTALKENEQNRPYAGDDLIVAEDVPFDDQIDADSVVSQDQSSTTSIASSILEYRKIHGRTYHSDRFATNYFIPNDDQQLESEEICACLTSAQDPASGQCKAEWNSISHACVLTEVTSEFADQYPHASVIGTDLSPCQPQWVPTNVSFEIDDASLDWTWNANHFDFIHVRYILGGIQDWSALFKEAYRCCAPGGWVESVEYEPEICSDDGTTELEPILASWGELFREASKVLNRPLSVKDIQKQAFDEAGFVEERVVRYKVPIGSWPKDRKLAEVGRSAGAALDNDLQGYSQMLWQIVQRPADEFQMWLATLRKAFRNPKVHSYFTVHVVYGRKLR
ncbi:hypothetical protein E4U16_007600 [Claviceps sp. LM84 group G4]|nr:hypothetical protein E4U16_007600 [Claviceps sp. LM84 group G4]